MTLFSSAALPTETEEAWSVAGKVLWLSSFERQTPFCLCFISCGNQICKAQVSRNGFQSPSRSVAALVCFNTGVPQQVLTVLEVHDFEGLLLRTSSLMQQEGNNFLCPDAKLGTATAVYIL